MEPGKVILVCCEGITVDRIRISEILQEIPGGVPHGISGVSLDAFRGEEINLCIVNGGWRQLRPDPMTGSPCFSERSLPLQLFETNHT